MHGAGGILRRPGCLWARISGMAKGGLASGPDPGGAAMMGFLLLFQTFFHQLLDLFPREPSPGQVRHFLIKRSGRTGLGQPLLEFRRKLPRIFHMLEKSGKCLVEAVIICLFLDQDSPGQIVEAQQAVPVEAQFQRTEKDGPLGQSGMETIAPETIEKRCEHISNRPVSSLPSFSAGHR